MPVKHAFNILISKYGVVLKVIVYYAIMMLILVSIAAGILAPIFGEMYDEIVATGIVDKIHLFVQEFLDGDGSVIDTFQAIGTTLHTVIDILQSNNAAVTKGLIVGGVFTVVYLYLISLANLVSSDIVNNFMNSNSRFGFVSNFLFNLKRSTLYGLLYLVTYLPATILIIAASFFLARALWHAGALLLALPMAILVFLIGQSLVLTVFGGWIPAIVVDNHNPAKGLSVGCKTMAKHFGFYWMSMFLAMFINFVLVGACTFFTAGFGFIIAFPTCIVLIKILELVLYYNANGYKFYETDKTVMDESIPDAE